MDFQNLFRCHEIRTYYINTKNTYEALPKNPFIITRGRLVTLEWFVFVPAVFLLSSVFFNTTAWSKLYELSKLGIESVMFWS